MRKFRVGVAVDARREYVVTVPDGYTVPEEELADENPSAEVIAEAILWEYRSQQMGYDSAFDVEGLVEFAKVEMIEWKDTGIMWEEACIS